MHPKLKLKIYEAIDKAINDACEDEMWTGYIYPELTTQMAESAALVFDSSMEAQRYAGEEENA